MLRLAERAEGDLCEEGDEYLLGMGKEPIVYQFDLSYDTERLN